MKQPADEPTITSSPEIILQAEKISKVYGGTIALNQVDFWIYRGKVNVLVGENGAGKSTLMKILAGVEQPTAGQLLLDGKPVEFKSPRAAAACKIGIIHQELSLFPDLNVAENIFLGHEEKQYSLVIHKKAQIDATKKLMQRLEQEIDPLTLVGALRLGQQQIVEIARALSQQVRLLIMDEPTSALTNAEAEVLFKLIRELKMQNVSIVYISHKMDELQKIGDYITILRDSRFIAHAEMKTIDTAWIVDQMVGRKIQEAARHAKPAPGRELLRVEHLTLPRAGGGLTLEDVTFSLQSGEILGLYGLMGAGRTELLECLMALHPEASGEIWLVGQRLQAGTLTRRLRQGLALVPEDRQREGLIQPLSVAQNMLLAGLTRYRQSFFLSARKEGIALRQMIERLGIKTAGGGAPILSLSGGNQQKVVVARNLLTRPKVLLMDEPTRGIDIGAKADMFKLMRQLINDGLGVIFVSSELREILAVADRVLVLAKGRLSGEFQAAEMTEQALVEASFAGYTGSVAQTGERILS